MPSVAVRPATPDDAEAVLAVERAVMPYKVRSVDTWRRSFTSIVPARRSLRLVATRDERVVGFGSAGLNIYTALEGAATLQLMVHPQATHRGAGTTLLGELEAHLRSIGATRVESYVTEESLPFARARGFTPSRPVHYLGVDLTSGLPSAPAVELTAVPIADVDPSALFDCDLEASQDEPSDVPFDAVDFDDWQRDVWDAPTLDHSLSRAMVEDGHVVAFTLVERADMRAWSGMTGVRRSHRGRGLAKALKVDALSAARADGVTQAFTSVDDSNAPMRAVNTWLGYHRVATQYPAHRAVTPR